MSESRQHVVLPTGWLLTIAGGVIIPIVIFVASQVVQVPQQTEAIKQVQMGMTQLRQGIEASNTDINTRLQQLALAVGQSEITNKGISQSLVDLRDRQTRQEGSLRDIDVRVTKNTVEMQGDARALRLESDAAERELKANLEAVKQSGIDGAARSKEVDDRMIATVRALSERVDALSMQFGGPRRNSFDGQRGDAPPTERPVWRPDAPGDAPMFAWAQ